MINAAAKRAQLNREAILSASPARLLTMLYDRLMLDLSRAESAQLSQDWGTANEQLLHAQAIVSELSSTLRADVWDGAVSLQALYSFANTTLIEANIGRSVAKTRQAIEVLEPLRQTWHEAAAQQSAVPAASIPSQTGGMLGVG